jgi:hypothetical protein
MIFFGCQASKPTAGPSPYGRGAQAPVRNTETRTGNSLAIHRCQPSPPILGLRQDNAGRPPPQAGCS